MQSYFFHLAFELYIPDSLNTQPDNTHSAFIPPPGADIFDSELPEHSTVPWGHSLDQTFQRTSHKRRNSDSSATSRKTVFGDSQPQSLRRSAKSKRQTSESGSHRSRVSAAKRDWRFDTVSIVSIDMEESNSNPTRLIRGKSFGNESRANIDPAGVATKGVFIPSDPKNTDVGYGIVHLYRDSKETPGLYEDDVVASKAAESPRDDRASKFDADQCTTLCILAVPSYMTPSDLLGYVGEKTREEVSHFRLIRTGRTNKYMVLMKFRSAKKAKEWQKAWDGKPFNSMEVSSFTRAQSKTNSNAMLARILSCRIRAVHYFSNSRAVRTAK
jgi:BRCA1-associated protein